MSLAARLAALLLLLPTPALANGGITEADVAEALSRHRLPIRLGNDTFREPMVESYAGSTRFYVNFYECAQSRTCRNIQFRTGYATKGRVTLAQINDWSSRWRFGRMYLDPQGDVILDMDVDARRGLNAAAVDAQIERWLEVVREAEGFIGWRR